MWFKKVSFLIADIFLIVVSLYLSYMLRLGYVTPIHYVETFSSLIVFVLLAKALIFHVFGFYAQLWQYASLKEGLRLLKGATTASVLILGALFF